jgi:hypothetical protein
MSATRITRFAMTNSAHPKLRIVRPAAWIGDESLDGRERATYAPDLSATRLLRVGFRRSLRATVVAVPLDKVGAAHKRATFADASVVVPQVEVGEIDGMGER